VISDTVRVKFLFHTQIKHTWNSLSNVPTLFLEAHQHYTFSYSS